MTNTGRISVWLVVALAMSGTGMVWAQIEPQADRILRAMGQYLGSAEEFRLQADISYDTFSPQGQELQYGGRAEISVRRPDRLRVEYHGDQRRNRVIYDGAAITFVHLDRNVYARAESDAGIDAAVDRLFELSGFSVPIADLVYADPYAVLIENVEAGILVGRHAVDGVPCHHLAFSQSALDWQIWIEDGPRPVPRKFVITYKNQPGSPQYVARTSGWDFQPRLSDHYFDLEVPAGAAETEFLVVPEVQPEEIEP